MLDYRPVRKPSYRLSLAMAVVLGTLTQWRPAEPTTAWSPVSKLFTAGLNPSILESKNNIATSKRAKNTTRATCRVMNRGAPRANQVGGRNGLA